MNISNCQKENELSVKINETASSPVDQMQTIKPLECGVYLYWIYTAGYSLKIRLLFIVRHCFMELFIFKLFQVIFKLTDCKRQDAIYMI